MIFKSFSGKAEEKKRASRAQSVFHFGHSEKLSTRHEMRARLVVEIMGDDGETIATETVADLVKMTRISLCRCRRQYKALHLVSQAGIIELLGVGWGQRRSRGHRVAPACRGGWTAVRQSPCRLHIELRPTAPLNVDLMWRAADVTAPCVWCRDQSSWQIGTVQRHSWEQPSGSSDPASTFHDTDLGSNHSGSSGGA